MNAWTKCRGKILLFLTKFGPMTYQSSTTFSFTSTAFADLAWEKSSAAFGSATAWATAVEKARRLDSDKCIMGNVKILWSGSETRV